MTYKGFNIGKVSKYIFHGFDDSEGYYWNVNKDLKNVHFDTLQEAKKYINKRLLDNETDKTKSRTASLDSRS